MTWFETTQSDRRPESEPLLSPGSEDLTISAVEKQMIQNYLEKYKYNKTEAAKAPNVTQNLIPPVKGVQFVVNAI